MAMTTEERIKQQREAGAKARATANAPGGTVHAKEQRRKPEYTPKTDSKPLTITVKGDKQEKPKAKPAARPAVRQAMKKKAAPKKDTSWAAEEREGIKKQRVRAAGKRVAREQMKGAKKPRRLASAVKPSKTGVASYKSFMGG